MKAITPFEAGSYGYRGNVMEDMAYYFAAGGASPFTDTPENCTPTLQFVGDRGALGMTGAGAAGDGMNFWQTVATIRPQTAKAIEFWWTHRSAAWATHQFMAGVSIYSADVIADVYGGTDPTDYIMVGKTTADTKLTARARKASGTKATQVCDMADGTNDAWYRGHGIITADPAATAGKGRFTLYYGLDSLDPIPQVLDRTFATEFPDTVSLAFGIAWAAGGAVTTQHNFHGFGWRIFK